MGVRARRRVWLLLPVLAIASVIAFWFGESPARRTPDRTQPESAGPGLPTPEQHATPMASDPVGTSPEAGARVIRVRVFAAPDRTPTEGAEVRVTNDESDTRARTGADGRAEIPTHKLGVVWVEARKLGFLPGYQTVVGGVNEATVVLARAPILRGRVVRDEDGKPVRGALVWVGDPDDEEAFGGKVETDPEGRFTVAVPRLAAYRIGVAADGYGNVHQVGVGGEGDTELDLRLGQGAVLRGTVRDPDGAAAPGVRLMLFPVDDDFVESYPCSALLGYTRLRRSARATTDGEGRFVYRGVAAGSYTLLAWGDELQTARVTPFVVGKEDAHVDLALQHQAGIRARVRGAKGEPIERVRLKVTDSAGKWILGPRFPAFTDRSGEALMGPLKPGRYRLHFTPPDALPAEHEVTVERDRIAVVAFEPRGGLALTGVVADAEGRPLAGMAVHFDRRAAPGVIAHKIRTHTDHQGRFRLRGLQPQAGTLEVQDWAQRYHPWKRTDVAPGPSLSVTLRKTTSLTGRVVPTPTTHRIRYTIAAARTQSTIADLTLDATGRFVVHGVPAGKDVTLAFDAADTVPVLRRISPLAEGEQRDLGTIQLTAGKSFRGRVRDQNGKPIAGIRVDLSLEEYGFERTVLTNEMGEFVVPNVPPGPVSVTFWTKESSGRGWDVENWTRKDVHEFEVRR